MMLFADFLRVLTLGIMTLAGMAGVTPLASQALQA
jgi:hypothetical protein